MPRKKKADAVPVVDVKGIIERDSGKLFDLIDSDAQISGLSGFVLSGLMEAHKEKAYLVTTGYNRNMIRFSRDQETTGGNVK